MDADIEYHWQSLVDKFNLHKGGANPWDANKLAGNLPGCSSAERQIILFLLHVYDPTGDWPAPFDFIEAFRTWDGDNKQALIDWANEPLWP